MANTNDNDARRTEIKRGWMWKPYNFMDLKKGDIFRLFDEGDDPAEIGAPCIALNDAFLNDDQIGTIDCEFYYEDAEE